MGKVFRDSIKASAAVLLGLGAITYATSASACESDSLMHSTSWQDHQSVGLLHQASLDNPGNHSIVGMWSFKMTSGGQTVDWGFQQWHSDGTELLTSGSRVPATGNFCMGVWRQVAPSRFHLNHYPLVVDNSGVLQARIIIKEDVTVDPSATSYAGTFTLDVYDPSGTTK